MSYYSSDDDLDIRVQRRTRSPHPPPPPAPPVRYVERPREREREYYGRPPGQYLVPEQHTTIVARSRDRERSRSRERPSPPAPPAPTQPVIINNRIYNEHSSDEDERYDYRRKTQLVHRRRRDRSSSSSSRSHSRSRSRSGAFMTRDEWEAEQARRELEQMRLANAAERDKRRLQKEYEDGASLQRAKRELDEIRAREARADEEKRITKELELKRLREEEEAADEKKRREKEAKEAVEAYKLKEAERIEKEKKQKEQNEKDYQRRLQEDLIKSGLDEKAIAAIMKKEKIPEANEPPPNPTNRPTYTRMAKKHLSIETLRTFRVDYEFDQDPEFVLIKRWVPEWEQVQFWKHTKIIRENRSRGLIVEEKGHRHRSPEFEWVRKKERRRSKSPGLLMYLAGGRPS